jgi:hypothetical protein
MRLQRAGLLMVVLSVGCGSNASYDGPSEAQREDSGQMPDQRSQGKAQSLRLSGASLMGREAPRVRR